MKLIRQSLSEHKLFHTCDPEGWVGMAHTSQCKTDLAYSACILICTRDAHFSWSVALQRCVTCTSLRCWHLQSVRNRVTLLTVVLCKSITGRHRVCVLLPSGFLTLKYKVHKNSFWGTRKAEVTCGASGIPLAVVPSTCADTTTSFLVTSWPLRV